MALALVEVIECFPVLLATDVATVPPAVNADHAPFAGEVPHPDPTLRVNAS